MLAIHSCTGFLLLLLVGGAMIPDVHAGFGLDFFRLGGEELGKKVAVVFQPDEGFRLRENFQKKYGPKGEELVKNLGGAASAAAGKISETEILK